MRRFLSILVALAVGLALVAAGAGAAPAPSPPPVPADDGLVVVIIPVDNMPVAAAAEQVRLLLSPRGVVVPDERTSRLVIKDTPERIERVRAHLKGADAALPMVSLTVDYGVSNSSGITQVGASGGVVVNSGGSGGGAVVITARNDQGTMSDSGVMKLTTMSGSEAVLSVGEQIPLVATQFFFDYAHRIGLIGTVVGYQDVSTGFGVVPRVLSNDEVVLRIYPRVAYASPAGPGVIRYFGAATEVRVRNGDTVTIAASSQDSSGLFTRILSTGRYSASNSGTIRVTPRIRKSPY